MTSMYTGYHVNPEHLKVRLFEDMSLFQLNKIWIFLKAFNVEIVQVQIFIYLKLSFAINVNGNEPISKIINELKQAYRLNKQNIQFFVHVIKSF